MFMASLKNLISSQITDKNIEIFQDYMYFLCQSYKNLADSLCFLILGHHFN